MRSVLKKFSIALLDDVEDPLYGRKYCCYVLESTRDLSIVQSHASLKSPQSSSLTVELSLLPAESGAGMPWEALTGTLLIPEYPYDVALLL